MKMTNNNDAIGNGEGGGTIKNKISNSNSSQINQSIVKLLSSNNSSPSSLPIMKSSSITYVTSETTTSSLINSTLTPNQIINNVENEIIKRDSNDIKSANQIKYDESFSITNGINKATQYNKSPKHTTRSNSTHSLDEYYSSSPIPTPKARSITKSNTIPLPSYSFNTNNSSNSSLSNIDECLNEYGYFYSEEELDTYKNVANFICKIAQLILRSRVGLSYNHNYNIKINKKNKNKETPIDKNSSSLNSCTNSFSNMCIEATYASSISSNESQTQFIPYSLNSSYNSSFDNSYTSTKILNSMNSFNRDNNFHIPTPSIDNIKQLHNLLIDRIPFWKNRIPINIDIFANKCDYGKKGNEGYRRRSNEYSYSNDLDKDYESSFNKVSDFQSSSTRVRSSSISNIYPTFKKTPSTSSSNKFNNKRLLERWVVSYELNDELESITKGRNSKIDTTDFILLVQSLYSYIRLMPLHSLLSDNSIKKTDLQYCISTADGFLLLPLLEEQNNDIEYCHIGSSGFDLSAKLKVYKFNKASTNLGNLNISVVYDANVNNKNPAVYPSNYSHIHSKSLSTISSSFLCNDTNLNTQAFNKVNSNQLNISNSLSSCDKSISKSNNDLNDSSVKTITVEDKTSKDKKDEKSDTPTDDESSSPNSRRKSCPTIGSPFPSPKTHTKVLSLTQNKYSNQTQNPLFSSTPNLIHKLVNKQRLEKYSSSVHSLSDNNSLSSQSNLLLSGFNYKKSNVTDFNKNKILGQESPSNKSLYHSYPAHSNRNNSYQNNSMELFGSLVGSYEESILSGRMSTLPSKPIKFISEIGVIGFGKCHPRLKCPPHINITFPVYFYEIPDQNDFFTTPYVGTVDIEQYLQKQYLIKQQKLQQKQQESQSISLKDEPEEKLNIDQTTTESVILTSMNKVENENQNNKNNSLIPSSTILLNNEPMLARTSSSSSLNGLSSKFPGYRIPYKGQIQVIIKNPSKTAVKVFLIPYDFHDMPPNSKTFIRQKSYLKDSRNPKDPKSSLRYAIQLQFVSPSKKRLYLCKTLRVVFAHKAPEKDEKLYTISDGPINPKYIPIVDINNKNYSQNSNDYSQEKFIGGTKSIMKPNEKGSSISKDESNVFSSSYSSRRRSSFGSNMMMLAEMGVNLGDYSVSPVKPILIHQHRQTTSGGNYSSINSGSYVSNNLNGLGIYTPTTSTTSTKITKPLYFKGNSPNVCPFDIHKRNDPKDISQEDINLVQPPLPYFSNSSKTLKYLHTHQYSYLSKNLEHLSNKLPPKAEESIIGTSYDLSNPNYSSGGLTKSVNDIEEEDYYSKSSKSTTGLSNFTTKRSLRKLTESSLNDDNTDNEGREEESNSLSSTQLKVFNYIN
ncbi:hypothetical protein BCR36DRAFT_327208 [Piromyces finnis]|uniref:Atos-like conserved domain-containing protein n=1 Tax=Piromyces finnis TaxID=1754191 RepID=A0A1Y1VBF2_9FUNG|nr:hypothetical protein BCR36DRAFT_327208 [Piromyces finnis]|eukprot:ORX50394.1 hypothetical protein BCR36DRAFT_327208 [Piromyces finnis]